MISIRFYPTIKHFTWRSYRISSCIVRSDFPIPELQAFETASSFEVLPPFCSSSLEEGEKKELIFQGQGWVGRDFRFVECWKTETGNLLSVSGVGHFWIALDGSEIVFLAPEKPVPWQQVIETCLGPALTLALARKRIWCLHASSVVCQKKDREAIVFLGDSGAGKSTLAAFFSTQPGWRRIADDVFPVCDDHEKIKALPHFPQFKLSFNDQPASNTHDSLDLKTIFLLNLPTDKEHFSPHSLIQSLKPSQAMISLLAHTIAARLFDASLLALHLEIFAKISQNVSIKRLVYPHQREILPLVFQAIEQNWADL